MSRSLKVNLSVFFEAPSCRMSSQKVGSIASREAFREWHCRGASRSNHIKGLVRKSMKRGQGPESSQK